MFNVKYIYTFMYYIKCTLYFKNVDSKDKDIVSFYSLYQL